MNALSKVPNLKCVYKWGEVEYVDYVEINKHLREIWRASLSSKMDVAQRSQE